VFYFVTNPLSLVLTGQVTNSGQWPSPSDRHSVYNNRPRLPFWEQNAVLLTRCCYPSG